MSDQTLIITKADLGEDNIYVGAADVSNWQGSIEIAANLGMGEVAFGHLVEASLTEAS